MSISESWKMDCCCPWKTLSVWGSIIHAPLPSYQKSPLKSKKRNKGKKKEKEEAEEIPTSTSPTPLSPFAKLWLWQSSKPKEKQLSFLGSMPVYMRKKKITKNVKPPLPIGPKNITHYQDALHESFNTVLMKKIFGKKAAQEVAGLRVDQEAGWEACLPRTLRHSCKATAFPFRLQNWGLALLVTSQL